MKIKNINKLILYSFFLLYFAIGTITFGDYGVNIEEHTQLYSGFYWLNYVFNVFGIDFLKDNLTEILNNISRDSYLPNPEYYTYGPVFDLPTAFIDLLLGRKDTYLYFKYRHFIVFLIYYLSSIIFFKILIKRFNNFFISFFGTILYIFSPRIYGDSFHNNKDIIFLSLVAFSLYFAFKIFEKKKVKYLFFFSLLAAVATSTRVIGIFLPISLIIFLFLEKLNSQSNKNTKLIILILLFYILSLIAHWPHLWENPILNFYEFVIKSKNWIFSYYILFNGEYVLTTSLPDTYIFTWIGISTPVLNLILFIFGFILITRRLFLRFISIDPLKNYNCDFWRGKNEMKDSFIIFNLISILSILVFLNVSLASGWRHLYFLNLFLIYLGVYFLNILSIRFSKYQISFISIFLILLIPNIYKLILFHPFQSLYINELVEEKDKNNYLIDREGLTRLDSIHKILSLSNHQGKINIANASFIPYYRINDALIDSKKSKINFVWGEYSEADYIYNNYVYEINPKFNDKYEIPGNFKKIYQLEINGLKMYEIWSKNSKK